MENEKHIPDPEKRNSKIIYDKTTNKVISNKVTYIEQEGNKQVTGKEQTGNREVTDLEQARKMTLQEISLKLHESISKNSVLVIKKQKKFSAAKYDRLLKIMQMSQIAAQNNNVELLKKLRTELEKDFISPIRTTALARQNKPKFDKIKFLKTNKLACWLLQNPKFIRAATNNHYKSFESLPENIPQSIVMAINNDKNVSRDNGEPHTHKTLTYLANILREKRKIRKIYKRKLMTSAAVVLVLIFFGYTVKNTFKGSNNTVTNVFSKDTINIETLINNYETTQNKVFTKYRKDLILKELSNSNFTKSELVYKIDSFYVEQQKLCKK